MISDQQLTTLFRHLQPLVSQSNAHAALICILKIEAILAFPHAPLSIYLPPRLLIAPKTSRAAFDLTDLPATEAVPAASAPESADDLLSDSDRLAAVEHLSSILLGAFSSSGSTLPTHPRPTLAAGASARLASAIAAAALTVLLHAPLAIADPARIAACSTLRRLIRDGALRRSALRHVVVSVLLRVLSTPAAAADAKVDPAPITPRADYAVSGGLLARPPGAVRSVIMHQRPGTSVSAGGAFPHLAASLSSSTNDKPSDRGGGGPLGAPIAQQPPSQQQQQQQQLPRTLGGSANRDTRDDAAPGPSAEELLLASECVALLVEDPAVAAAAARRQATVVLACAVGSATSYPASSRVGRRRVASRVTSSQNELMRNVLTALGRVCAAVSQGACTASWADATQGATAVQSIAVQSIPPLVSIVAVAPDPRDLTSTSAPGGSDGPGSSPVPPSALSGPTGPSLGAPTRHVAGPPSAPSGSRGHAVAASGRSTSPPLPCHTRPSTPQMWPSAGAMVWDRPVDARMSHHSSTSLDDAPHLPRSATCAAPLVSSGTAALSRMCTSPNILSAAGAAVAAAVAASNMPRRHSSSFSYAGPTVSATSAPADSIARRRLPPMSAAVTAAGGGGSTATSASVSRQGSAGGRGYVPFAYPIAPITPTVPRPPTSAGGTSPSHSVAADIGLARSSDARVNALVSVPVPSHGLVRAGAVDACARFITVTIPAEVLCDALRVAANVASSVAACNDLVRRLGPRGLLDVTVSYVRLAASATPAQMAAALPSSDTCPQSQQLPGFTRAAPCPAAACSSIPGPIPIPCTAAAAMPGAPSAVAAGGGAPPRVDGGGSRCVVPVHSHSPAAPLSVSPAAMHAAMRLLYLAATVASTAPTAFAILLFSSNDAISPHSPSAPPVHVFSPAPAAEAAAALVGAARAVALALLAVPHKALAAAPAASPAVIAAARPTTSVPRVHTALPHGTGGPVFGALLAPPTPSATMGGSVDTLLSPPLPSSSSSLSPALDPGPASAAAAAAAATAAAAAAAAASASAQGAPMAFDDFVSPAHALASAALVTAAIAATVDAPRPAREAAAAAAVEMVGPLCDVTADVLLAVELEAAATASAAALVATHRPGTSLSLSGMAASTSHAGLSAAIPSARAGGAPALSASALSLSSPAAGGGARAPAVVQPATLAVGITVSVGVARMALACAVVCETVVAAAMDTLLAPVTPAGGGSCDSGGGSGGAETPDGSGRGSARAPDSPDRAAQLAATAAAATRSRFADPLSSTPVVPGGAPPTPNTPLGQTITSPYSAARPGGASRARPCLPALPHFVSAAAAMSGLLPPPAHMLHCAARAVAMLHDTPLTSTLDVTLAARLVSAASRLLLVAVASEWSAAVGPPPGDASDDAGSSTWDAASPPPPAGYADSMIATATAIATAAAACVAACSSQGAARGAPSPRAGALGAQEAALAALSASASSASGVAQHRGPRLPLLPPAAAAGAAGGGGGCSSGPGSVGCIGSRPPSDPTLTSPRSSAVAPPLAAVIGHPPESDYLGSDPSALSPPRPTADPLVALTLAAMATAAVLARCGRIVVASATASTPTHSSSAAPSAPSSTPPHVGQFDPSDPAAPAAMRARTSDGVGSIGVSGPTVESADGSDDEDEDDDDVDGGSRYHSHHRTRVAIARTPDAVLAALCTAFPASVATIAALQRSRCVASGLVTYRDIVTGTCAVEFGTGHAPDAFAALMPARPPASASGAGGAVHAAASPIRRPTFPPSVASVPAVELTAPSAVHLVEAVAALVRAAGDVAARLFVPEAAAAVATAAVATIGFVSMAADRKASAATASLVGACVELVTPSARPPSAVV